MSLELTGTVDLRNDLTEMADKLSTSGGHGGRATRYILQQAAVPVLRQMMHNAATDPKMRSHKLHDSIKIGKVVKRRKGGYRVTVGVHRSDGGAEYANPVEFGHGGPHPAPAHPFVRPAFDAAKEEAYEQVKRDLQTALEARGLL